MGRDRTVSPKWDWNCEFSPHTCPMSHVIPCLHFQNGAQGCWSQHFVCHVRPQLPIINPVNHLYLSKLLQPSAVSREAPTSHPQMHVCCESRENPQTRQKLWQALHLQLGMMGLLPSDSSGAWIPSKSWEILAKSCYLFWFWCFLQVEDICEMLLDCNCWTSSVHLCVCVLLHLAELKQSKGLQEGSQSPWQEVKWGREGEGGEEEQGEEEKKGEGRERAKEEGRGRRRQGRDKGPHSMALRRKCHATEQSRSRYWTESTEVRMWKSYLHSCPSQQSSQ